MSFEYTLAEFEFSLARISLRPVTVAVPSPGWWSLTQIVLGGLLLTYLLGWVQDFERVRDLRVEPSLSPKVIITKNQAWERVYPRKSRPRTLAAAVPSQRHEAGSPSEDPPRQAVLAMLDP